MTVVKVWLGFFNWGSSNWMASQQWKGDGALVGARSHQPFSNSEMKRNLKCLWSPTSNVKVSTTQVCFWHWKNKWIGILQIYLHTLKKASNCRLIRYRKNYVRVYQIWKLLINPNIIIITLYSLIDMSWC